MNSTFEPKLVHKSKSMIHLLVVLSHINQRVLHNKPPTWWKASLFGGLFGLKNLLKMFSR